MEIWLFILGFLAGGFALQSLLLRLTRNRWRVLRWVALLPVAALLLMAWKEYDTSHIFGLSGLVVLFYLALAACVLVGWGTAWGVYALGRLARKVSPGSPSHTVNDTGRGEEEADEKGDPSL